MSRYYFDSNRARYPPLDGCIAAPSSRAEAPRTANEALASSLYQAALPLLDLTQKLTSIVTDRRSEERAASALQGTMLDRPKLGGAELQPFGEPRTSGKRINSWS
jgi:hypothetical protein